MNKLDRRLGAAISEFWRIREQQSIGRAKLPVRRTAVVEKRLPAGRNSAD